MISSLLSSSELIITGFVKPPAVVSLSWFLLASSSAATSSFVLSGVFLNLIPKISIPVCLAFLHIPVKNIYTSFPSVVSLYSEMLSAVSKSVTPIVYLGISLFAIWPNTVSSYISLANVSVMLALRGPASVDVTP